MQRFDPAGVGARQLGECLALQLAPLPDDTPGKALAQRIAHGPIEKLPKVGLEGIAAELQCDTCDVDMALQLLRTLDPRPGAQVGSLPSDTYITPDCVHPATAGLWRVALAGSRAPRLTIHRGYEQMIGHSGASDSYLRGRLQEARWLLAQPRGARGNPAQGRALPGAPAVGLPRVRGAGPAPTDPARGRRGGRRCTNRRSRARSPASTCAPRAAPWRCAASSPPAIDTEGGGEASSIAIQTMIRRLIETRIRANRCPTRAWPKSLKASGVPVARRTVAKYREAMGIASSQDRVRIA